MKPLRLLLATEHRLEGEVLLAQKHIYRGEGIWPTAAVPAEAQVPFLSYEEKPEAAPAGPVTWFVVPGGLRMVRGGGSPLEMVFVCDGWFRTFSYRTPYGPLQFRYAAADLVWHRPEAGDRRGRVGGFTLRYQLGDVPAQRGEALRQVTLTLDAFALSDSGASAGC